MPSKNKPSREQALAWALAGVPSPSVLAWNELPAEPSAQIRYAAAVVVGAPSPTCVERIAARLARIEAAYLVDAQPERPNQRRG